MLSFPKIWINNVLMGICHLHFSGSQNQIHKLSAYVLARLAGLSPAAPSPSFLTSLWPRKELCTTGSGNTNHRRSMTILFSSVQNNSTDRVRCHPWSALIFWNAKIKQYAWPPSAPFDLPHDAMDPTPFEQEAKLSV